MASDTPQTTATLSPAAETLDVRDKIRIRFRKSGELRLLSHHDLMRAFERMLRRADLPFRNSQGFHPKPRLIFALSLPLGVVGCEEVVELELSQILPLDELEQRLTAQCPRGLDLLSFRRLPQRAGAQVRSFTYRIPVPPERVAALEERIHAVLSAADCVVERQKPAPKRVDLRAFIRDLRVDSFSLEMNLWLTQQGTARPEEVLTILGVNDLLDAGAVLERVRLELTDEIPSPSSVEGIA